MSFVIWNYLYSDHGWLTFWAKVTWDQELVLFGNLCKKIKLALIAKRKFDKFINLDHNIIQDGFCKLFLLIFKIFKGTMRYSQQWSCVTVKDTDTCVLDQISTLPWVMKAFYICRNSCQLPLNKVCNFSHEGKWHGILSLRPFSMFLNCEWPPVLLPLGNWDFAICLQWGLLLTLTWPNIIKLYIMIWAMLVWHRNQGQFSTFTKYLLDKVINKWEFPKTKQKKGILKDEFAASIIYLKQSCRRETPSVN